MMRPINKKRNVGIAPVATFVDREALQRPQPQLPLHVASGGVHVARGGDQGGVAPAGDHRHHVLFLRQRCRQGHNGTGHR